MSIALVGAAPVLDCVMFCAHVISWTCKYTALSALNFGRRPWVATTEWPADESLKILGPIDSSLPKMHKRGWCGQIPPPAPGSFRARWGLGVSNPTPAAESLRAEGGGRGCQPPPESFRARWGLWVVGLANPPPTDSGKI